MGAAPPSHAGHAVLGLPFFPVHVIILPVTAKSLDINSILIILIIFIMLLNFTASSGGGPPPPLYLTPRLWHIFAKFNTILFKFGDSSTPH